MVASRSDRKNVSICRSCEGSHWSQVCGKTKKQRKVFSSNPKPVFVENKYSVLDYDSMPDQRRVYPIRFNKKCRNEVKNDNKSCHFNKKKYSSNDKNRRKKNQYYQEKSFISVNHKSGNLNKTFVKDFTKKSWNRQGMVPCRQDKKNIVSKKKICDSLKTNDLC